MKNSILFLLTASTIASSASAASANFSRNIGSPSNGYQLIHTVDNAGSKAPGNYHYVPVTTHSPRPITNNHKPIITTVAPKPVTPHVAPTTPKPTENPAKPTSGSKPIESIKPVSKPEATPQIQPQEAIKRGNTTLAGDLGLKYNLGRDVSLTAKYGTDSRYGLSVGAQLTPSLGLDAEAYRKDQDNAIRFGVVYTLNPVEHKATVTAPVIRYVDRVVPSAPTIKYVDRVITKTVIKIVPYKPATKSVRGRG